MNFIFMNFLQGYMIYGGKASYNFFEANIAKLEYFYCTFFFKDILLYFFFKDL